MCAHRSVTSVGGTQGSGPEQGWDGSSGGFSTYYKRPSYQNAAVTTFLETLAPGTYKGLFNPKGRAFPDVSAQGVNFIVDIGGQGQGVSGTSASSPTFAAVVALLNDEQQAQARQGPARLPQPAPVLAGRRRALNDITAGSNAGCGTDGFLALEGWDPVTGLGTPDYGKLRKAVGL